MTTLNKIMIFLSIVLYLVIAFLLGALFAHSKYYNDFTYFMESAAGYIYDELTDSNPTVWIDNEELAHDGFLLVSRNYQDRLSAILIDPEGKVVKDWFFGNEVVNKDIYNHFDKDYIELDSKFFAASDTHLLPNGDVVALIELNHLRNLRGMRILRMDKDSNIVWENIGYYHHEIDIDDGKIYALSYRLEDSFPKFNDTDDYYFMHDEIEIIDLESGETLEKYSLPDGFVGTKFEDYLNSARLYMGFQHFDLEYGKGFDVLHSNSVEYIDQNEAAGWGIAEEGDLLISMRGPSLLALFRPDEGKIIWAERNIWRNQHYARMAGEGVIRVYDNEGAGKIQDGEFVNIPRIVDYNITKDAAEVLFFEPELYKIFSSYWRGHYVELGDNNWLVNFPESGRIMQVVNGELVWEFRLTDRRDVIFPSYKNKTYNFRYYSRQYIENAGFLDKDSVD